MTHWTSPSSLNGHPRPGRSPPHMPKSASLTTISVENGMPATVPVMERMPILSQTQGKMKSTTTASSCTTRRSLSTGGCVTEYRLSLHLRQLFPFYDNYASLGKSPNKPSNNYALERKVAWHTVIIPQFYNIYASLGKASTGPQPNAR